ncbi:MAG TPA: hypothetical protein VIG30_03305 [Ktedonobacterales bacterium]
MGFDHLESLTWTFMADAEPVSAIYVYSEPHQTPRGVVYAPRIAAESGMEGVACVDDVARAATLGALAYARTSDTHAAHLARRWLRFVTYMQLDDGRFTNFVLDRAGTRHLDGATSFPGGAWWTARALWALATAYRVFGDRRALAALQRCPIPAPETPGELKTRAVLALAGVEVLRSNAPSAVRALWRRRVRRWCDALVRAADGRAYVPDYAPDHAPDAPGQAGAALWGYHQLHALASAAGALRDPAYLEAAERTAWGLARPVLAGNFYYRYPDDRANQCAYCVTPLAQGLAELYRVTGVARYRTLALRAMEWFAGANDAGAVMYDVASGRCYDGLTDTNVSRNCGAESAIEAGFAELERRALTTPREQPRQAEAIF